MGKGFLPQHPSTSTTKRKFVQPTANLLGYFFGEKNNIEQTAHTNLFKCDKDILSENLW